MSVNRWTVAINPFDGLMSRLSAGVCQHRVALLLLLLLNLADMITTHVGLSIGIPEGNPLPAMLLAGGGQAAMFASKMFVMSSVSLLVCLLVGWYPKLRFTFVVTNVVLFVVVISNFTQILAVA